jgi:hypothetical protein
VPETSQAPETTEVSKTAKVHKFLSQPSYLSHQSYPRRLGHPILQVTTGARASEAAEGLMPTTGVHNANVGKAISGNSGSSSCSLQHETTDGITNFSDELGASW